jgi:hypothetical protein
MSSQAGAVHADALRYGSGRRTQSGGGMTQVLVTKPSSVSESDRALLHDAGVIVVETFDPSSIKLLEVSGIEVGGSGLLYCALKALNSGETYTSSARAKFAEHVFAEIERQRTKPYAMPKRDEKGRFLPSQVVEQ